MVGGGGVGSNALLGHSHVMLGCDNSRGVCFSKKVCIWAEFSKGGSNTFSSLSEKLAFSK